MGEADVIIDGEIPEKCKDEYSEYAEEIGIDEKDGYYLSNLKLDDAYLSKDSLVLFFVGKNPSASVTAKIPISELIEILSQEDIYRKMKEIVEKANKLVQV